MPVIVNPYRFGGSAPVDPFVKPAKWSVTSAGVASAFQPLWTGLDMCFPIWDGSGNPIDVAPSAGGRILNLNGHSYNTSDPDEPVLDINDVAQMVTSTGSSAGNSQNRAVLAVFTPISYPSSDLFRHIWGYGGGGAWLADLGFDDRGYILYYEVTGGAVNFFSPIGTTSLGNRYAVMAVSNNSSGARIHVNGVQVTTDPTTGYLNIGGITGASNISNSPFVGGTCHWLLHMTASWWGTAPSAALCNLLTSDPYGLVRPA
jgi:hypothetical protein